MLGAALAPWQNVLMLSFAMIWTNHSTSIDGKMWKGDLCSWWDAGQRVLSESRYVLDCVGIIAFAFRFAKVVQFLGYLVAIAGNYNDPSIENNPTKEQSCNDGTSRTMTTSRVKLIDLSETAAGWPPTSDNFRRVKLPNEAHCHIVTKCKSHIWV